MRSAETPQRQQPKKLSRKEFLKRAGAAAVGVTASPETILAAEEQSERA